MNRQKALGVLLLAKGEIAAHECNEPTTNVEIWQKSYTFESRDI